MGKRTAALGAEIDLLTEAERGDLAAISALYRDYHGPLSAYARRRGGDDPGGIADLAIMDGLRALPRLRNRTEVAFRAYLYQAVRSRIASEHRRKSMKFEPLNEGTAAEVDSGAPGPCQIVTARLGFRDLVDKLSPAQQQVIEHRFVTGLSIDETAERVNRSSVAVKQLQAQALKRLRVIVAVAAAFLVAVLGAIVVLRGEDSPSTITTDPVGEEGDQGGARGTARESVDVEDGPQLQNTDSPGTPLPESSAPAEQTSDTRSGEERPEESRSSTSSPQPSEQESTVPSSTAPEQIVPPTDVETPSTSTTASTTTTTEPPAPNPEPFVPGHGAEIHLRNHGYNSYLADVGGSVFVTSSVSGGGTVWVAELESGSLRFRNRDSGRYLQSAAVDDVQLVTVGEKGADTLWQYSLNEDGEPHLIRAVASGLNLTFRLDRVEVEAGDRNRTRWEFLPVTG